MYSVVVFLIDKFLVGKLKSIRSFGIVILLKSILSLLVFICLIILSIFIYVIPKWESFNSGIIKSYLFSKEGGLALSFIFLIAFVIQFVRQVDKKFGPGNLIRMLKGVFHVPREVDRIVMFLDLKSSTTIAETIGHVNYNRLIQECFYQLDMTSDFAAEIYQYVGDEVVIVWESEKGLKNSNILKLFYSYKKALMDRAESYKAAYDVVPIFKCGCHIGKVVMTEIGHVKREIAFHGDVMNTAARIQSKCNLFRQEFLVSDELYKLLANDSSFKFEFISDDILKGKKSKIKIYSVCANDVN